MKILICFVAALIIGLAACASEPVGPSVKQQIRDCVNSGGLPQYTSDKYGYVVDYFGCVRS